LSVTIQYNLQAFAEHGVGVHTTFYQEVANRYSTESDKFLHEVNQIVKGQEEDRIPTDIVFTGHSQGGALAMALYSMIKLFPKPGGLDAVQLGATAQMLLKDSRAITFGAPMVFARCRKTPSPPFLEAMRTCKNFIYGNDPVPSLS